MKRVKFYTKDDLSTNLYANRIIDIDSSEFPVEPTIIDLLEYNNIIRFYEEFSESQFIKDLKKSKVDYYTIINKNIGKYINDFESIYNELRANLTYFIDEYLLMLNKYKKTGLIEISELKYLLTLEVNSWDKILNESVYCKLFKKVDNYIELIKKNKTLAKYISMEYVRYGKVSLVEKDNINEIIGSYINQSYNSIDMLDIEKSKVDIDARLKQAAKRKKEELDSNIPAISTPTMNVSIQFCTNTNMFEFSYDEKRIEEKWNFDQILTNDYSQPMSYKLVFEFIAKHMSLLSEVMNISDSSYDCGANKGIATFFATEHNSYLSKNHMYRYKAPITLTRLKLLIEYLKEKINIYQFLNYVIDILIPGDFFVINDSENYYNNSLNAINKHLCIQIDYLLSEYECLQKYKKIDKELIELNGSSSIDFNKYRGLNAISYIYPKENNIYFQMIDNQSLYSGSIVNKSSNLFNDIWDQEIKEVEYQYYEKLTQKSIEYFISNNIVEWSEGKLVFCEKDIAIIMKSLFEHGAININYMNVSSSEVETLKEKGLIETDDRLFNKYETEYFHYILNNKDHNDSLAIRNDYLHNGEAKISDEEANIYLIKALLEIILTINLEMITTM